MYITASQYLNNSDKKKLYTGVFHYTRPVRSKHDKNIEMYGLLSVKSEVDIPGANIAKFAWDGLVDGFEYSKADSTNEALKIALNEATRRIKQLITNDKNISDHGVDINFSVFVSGSSGLYVGYLGDCDIYIYKKGKIVDIHEMLSKKGAKTAGLLLEEEDILLASTKGFVKNSMSSLTGLPNSKSILERLDDMAHELGDGEGILIFTKGEELDEQEVALIESDVKIDEKGEIVVEKKEVEAKAVRQERRFDLKNWFLPLKTFLLRIGEKVSPMLAKLKPLFEGVKEIFRKVWYSIKRISKGILLNLNEKFAKQRWYKKVSAKFSQSDINLARKNEFKGFKVDGYKIKNKKIERFKIAGLVFLGIVVIVGGAKFTIDQKEARAISKQANEIFSSVETSVTSAEEKARTDRSGAEMLLFKAQSELGNIPEKLGEKDSEKLKQLEGRVLGIQDNLYKRVGLVDSDGSIESFIDTRLAFGEGSKPQDIAIYQDSRANEYLLVVDSGLKAVFRVSLYNKEVLRLSDPDRILQEPTMIYTGRSGIFVVDLKVGVVRAEYDSEGGFKPFAKLTGLGIDNIGANDIAEFAVLTDTDNVYILDRDAGVLLKSNNFGTGYGLSFGYIKEESLKQANDIMADLSVYILTSGADGLKRYIYSYFESKQIPARLDIVGLDGEFKNLTYGYTRGDLNYDLYVFDSEDRRIVRLVKPIEGGGEIRHPNQAVLRNQYVYRGSREKVFENVRDFVVNRDQKTLYMLDSSTVWKIRL
ncbi:hypothetical protein CVU76_00110 [Candidatus Dojkabacteria bacterium HGW-Dojkabacteria-1]|uniref:PPM-type phosphatase domain-containing protein n=1 Tax=Candidatus Dojkabacteria bacterium HGW-Dojkabacteria-1 TaxID=2013761 RepID=A0A2N2F2S0_9BACT|nr:MAG: hypothetical protein CVU76_00110 [Candidatus Dojkabacteria bacterium HGW-Dojkabacteria-1]